MRGVVFVAFLLAGCMSEPPEDARDMPDEADAPPDAVMRSDIGDLSFSWLTVETFSDETRWTMLRDVDGQSLVLAAAFQADDGLGSLQATFGGQTWRLDDARVVSWHVGSDADVAEETWVFVGQA